MELAPGARALDQAWSAPLNAAGRWWWWPQSPPSPSAPSSFSSCTVFGACDGNWKCDGSDDSERIAAPFSPSGTRMDTREAAEAVRAVLWGRGGGDAEIARLEEAHGI